MNNNKSFELYKWITIAHSTSDERGALLHSHSLSVPIVLFVVIINLNIVCK